MTTLTQQGIEAMQRGDKATARQLLQQAIQQDPQDAKAWLWLSGTVSTDLERLKCLQQVIKIDPENTAATKGIMQLVSRGIVTMNVAPAKEQVQQNRSMDVPQNSQQSMPHVETHRADPRPAAMQQRQPREKVIFKVSPSSIPVIIRGALLLILLYMFSIPFREFGSYLLLIMIPLSIFVIFLIIIRLIQRSFAVYTLTSTQLIVQKGVLNKQKKTIPIHKIQDVSYRQPILDRIFGLGDVVVESAGEKGEVYLEDLHHCVELSENILELVKKN